MQAGQGLVQQQAAGEAARAGVPAARQLLHALRQREPVVGLGALEQLQQRPRLARPPRVLHAPVHGLGYRSPDVLQLWMPPTSAALLLHPQSSSMQFLQ